MTPRANEARAADDGASATPGLGSALRAARLARHESLATVAAATGISKSSLSLIENDRADITLSRLVRLAEHYRTHLDDLLPTRGHADPIVTRRNERRMLHSPGEGVDIHLLAPDRNRAMMPIVGVVAPGGGGDFARHDGEELVIVLEGRMRLELEGSPPIMLERGDCAYYESTRPHRWTNDGDTLARLLSVSTPPRW
jgi:quercetin dioxygenase-like cupin family protein/DNA-binding Xre family transcriptional regulator